MTGLRSAMRVEGRKEGDGNGWAAVDAR